MEGRATLTIDTSSTTMNWATQAMARMTQSGVRRPFGVVVGPSSWVSASVMGSSVP